MSSHGSDSSMEENKGDNPFDFDVDFAQVQRQRRAKVKQVTHKEESSQSILEGMDAVDDDVAVTKQKGGKRRPNLIQKRAKSTGHDVAASAAGRSFFSAFYSNTDDNPVSDMHEDEYVMEEGPFKIGNRCLAVWPFDDYHLVQKMYYEKLQDVDGALPSGRSEFKDDGFNSKEQQSSIPIFSRPADPPDIPTAVQGLSLTDFEGKAEERSIKIVSCWLFDAGLIDELLVNGGISSLTVDGDNRSVQTSEGVEVGASGFPLEGSTKMDKEISKLRNSTRRQLALINARLNDGVAATGSEVQELVNAVVATKDDLGRLRELSTYVSNPNNVEETSQFMLTKYPKLKQAINARRNLQRCFRELDLFNQISTTCDRLREELQVAEYTAHEWSTIRSVCREHIELEMFLVEAEAGMKQRSDEDQDEPIAKGRSRRGERRQSNKFGRQALGQSGLGERNNNALIDRFLEEHVDNVWDLGKEIRGRIMQGIADAFELAMTNPAGMVALAEAVEVYETANDEYKRVHGEEAMRTTKMRFTEMRPAALGELYKNFEQRGETVFQDVKRQAADVAEEDDASNQQFTAVLRAANELTSEIGIVKEQMVPCFPPNWDIETLWTTCVAQVCSTNILQQIGGLEGRKLEDLSAAQLLDLVAWVETFRDIIEETFPNLGESTSKRNYNDKPPNLLSDDGKKVDIDRARDSLAWVQNTLWEVHDMSKVDFLRRTQNQTREWLANVYGNRDKHMRTQTAEGRLVTSLCEDVFAVAGAQLRTIRDRLTRRSEAMAEAVGVVLQTLYRKQIESRESFCIDFETCCAAANDFIRMSEKCEEIIEEIKDESDLSRAATDTLDEMAFTILALYSADAVYAAQKTHMYCFEPIEEAIASELFGTDWVKSLTHNELALTLVRTLDDFMEDLEAFLDEVMVQKAIEAQIASAVNFYVKSLLKAAASHNSNRASFFQDQNMMALGRLRGDVLVIRDYFNGLAESSMPTLPRVIEHEFAPLEHIMEILSIAAGLSDSDIQDFAILLQKRVRNVAITRFVIADLYHLVNPAEEKKVVEQLEALEEQMIAVAPTDEKAVKSALDRKTVPGLRLDHTMASCLVRSKRKRPVKSQSLEALDKALDSWRSSVREDEA